MSQKSLSSGREPPSPEQQELSGEILEIHEKDAICWLEVAPGVQVKSQISLEFLQHLRPEIGKQFQWSPGMDGRPDQFHEQTSELPDPELLQEFEETNCRFHKVLQPRQLRIEEDA